MVNTLAIKFQKMTIFDNWMKLWMTLIEWYYVFMLVLLFIYVFFDTIHLCYFYFLFIFFSSKTMSFVFKKEIDLC